MGDEAERITSRFGFLGHGILYLLLTVAAGRLLVGASGSGDASASGAISSLAEQPVGRVILVPIAVAFACYGTYRAVRAVRDESWFDRVTQAARGTLWFGLAGLTAVNVVRGGRGSGGGSTERSVTAAILSWPVGPWLVAAVGLGVVAVGGYLMWRAFSGDMVDELGVLGLDERRAARWLGGVGHAGRGLAYGAVGLFLVRAGVTHDPNSGQGLDAALEELRRGPLGLPILLAVTMGFGAFGLFRLVESRYRFDKDSATDRIEGS